MYSDVVRICGIEECRPVSGIIFGCVDTFPFWGYVHSCVLVCVGVQRVVVPYWKPAGTGVLLSTLSMFVNLNVNC